MNAKKRAFMALATILALTGLASCKVGDRLSQGDRDRLVARFERQLSKELDLTDAQEKSLDRSVTAARARLASRPRPDEKTLAAAREAFVAGGEGLNLAIDAFAEARRSDTALAANREALRDGLRDDFRPFLECLTQGQRGKLFDLVARRRDL